MSSSCTSFINEEFNSDEKKTAKHTRNTLAFFFCSVTNCTWLSHSLSLSLSFCHTHAHTVDAFVYNSLFQWHAIASHILFDFAKCSHHYCLVWFNFSFALNCVCSSIWVEEKRFIHTNFWNILDWDFFSEHKIRPHTMNSQNWKPSFSNYIHQTECHSKCDEMCLLLYRTYSIKKKKKVQRNISWRFIETIFFVSLSVDSTAIECSTLHNNYLQLILMLFNWFHTNCALFGLLVFLDDLNKQKNSQNF